MLQKVPVVCVRRTLNVNNKTLILLVRGFRLQGGPGRSIVDERKYNDPKALYDAKISAGELTRDSFQVSIIEKMQHLNKKCNNYQPVLKKETSAFTQFLTGPPDSSGGNKKLSNAPVGFYMYGSVGCGKTMLMDLFYETCHVANKRRVHFHEFMHDVHKRIHLVKRQMPRQRNVQKAQSFDPIGPVARDISAESWLLCFDEFQVTDIADAMILKRLFHILWENGVVVIATSNRKPDDLYKNGLQRLNFLPFIPMLKAQCEVINLDSGIDYRRRSMPEFGKIYFIKSQCNSEQEINKVYSSLSKQLGGSEGSAELNVMGRRLHLKKTCGKIVDCTFNELCNKALGAADYIEISKQFDVLILRNIPTMDLEKKNQARRFIHLIDTIYDNKMRLVCSAEKRPEELFAIGDLSNEDKHQNRVMMGDLNIRPGEENMSASLFTGEEEKFAFERVISRLTEMQTTTYWNQRDHIRSKKKN